MLVKKAAYTCCVVVFMQMSSREKHQPSLAYQHLREELAITFHARHARRGQRFIELTVEAKEVLRDQLLAKTKTQSTQVWRPAALT